jgi:hypothetical protein
MSSSSRPLGEGNFYERGGATLLGFALFAILEIVLVLSFF